MGDTPSCPLPTGTARSHTGLILESHTLCFSETWQPFLEQFGKWLGAKARETGSVLVGRGRGRLCAKGLMLLQVGQLVRTDSPNATKTQDKRGHKPNSFFSNSQRSIVVIQQSLISFYDPEHDGGIFPSS